jgi:ABC-type multidrug transport system fused ATPase/permease subunit
MPLWDLLWAMLWLFFFIGWIWLVISIFVDIFRSDDLSGWGKALWALVVLIIPLLGVLIYLIARGGRMHERAANEQAARERATQKYIRDAAGTGEGGSNTADEFAKLGKLRDDGVLSDDEYAAQKAKLLA